MSNLRNTIAVFIGRRAANDSFSGREPDARLLV